ncbi:FecR family protein [Prevotella sp. kh1p2]|uniref:FecR family protein n=1 Tax=Prevotella sp. kh1p2 TaxID=1761883 RepID=UPI0008B4D6FC|nr:FecR domain-containing protein [Prevotella sp. kh1p2]SES70894.1 FecR family protein [Prevotella sp. kh1p2]SNU10393.1 FecR family protein [Prevotellaceae bacterium KH2P17]
MEQQREHIDELIVQLFTGTITSDDYHALQQWIAASADHERYFLQRQEVWFSAVDAGQLAKYDSRKAFNTFRLRTANAISSRHNELHTRPRSHRLAGYIAAVAVAFIVGYLGYQRGEGSLAASFADITVEAPEGSRTMTILPDGTKAWLNAGSRLIYSQGFGLKDRNVWMDGEGYFEVKKNEKLPFSVRTNSLKVNDLGTTFNLRDYAEDEEAVISLIEGKVNFATGKAGKLYGMSPNQKAVYNKSTGKVDIYGNSATASALWTKGKITLNGQPLTEIARLLERSYGVHITIADTALYNRHFYGEFHQEQQSIYTVLNALAATGRLKYRKAQKGIVLY